MRTVSTELVAAAANRAAPFMMQAQLLDTQQRWSTIKADETEPTMTPCVAFGDALYRVRVVSGEIQVSVNPDPTDSDNEDTWDTWTTVRDDALADSYCAITTFLSGTRLRIVYQNLYYDVRAFESTDGTSWGTPITMMFVDDSRIAYFAAADKYVYIMDNGTVYTYHRTPPWVAFTAGATFTGLADEYGIAAAPFDATTNLLVYAADGALTARQHNLTANSFGSTTRILPQADATLPTDSTPRYPYLCAANVGHTLTVQATNLGTTPWLQNLSARTRDGIHYGAWTPLPWQPTDPDNYTGLAVAYIASSKRIYATNAEQIAETTDLTWNDTSFIEEPTTLEYHYHQRFMSPGELHVKLLDAGSSFTHYALRDQIAAGGPYSAIRIQRGYLTENGEEMEPTEPWYLTRVAYNPLNCEIDIEAANTWSLLSMFRHTDTLQYTSKSISYILADLFALAGLAYEDDSSTALSRTISLIVPPSQSFHSAITNLLNLGAAIARVDEDGTVIAADSATWSPVEYPTIYTGTVASTMTLGWTQPLPVRIQVSSLDYSVTIEDNELGASTALRLTDRRTHTPAASEAQLDDIAAHVLQLATWQQEAGTAIIPPRPEIELFEKMRLSARPPFFEVGVPNAILLGLAEYVQPKTARCEQTIYFGAWPW